MKKTLVYEFDDDDQKEDFNAAASGSDLALCLYLILERIRREWEYCDEDSRMDKLIQDIRNIEEERIGTIENYTY